jgi:hypothetical protein
MHVISRSFFGIWEKQSPVAYMGRIPNTADKPLYVCATVCFVVEFCRGSPMPWLFGAGLAASRWERCEQARRVVLVRDTGVPARAASLTQMEGGCICLPPLGY